MRGIREGRLVWYGRRADKSEFWSEHWQRTNVRRTIESAQTGDLGPLRPAFLHHLPRQGRILEAGCGLGRFLIPLAQRGYDIVGVDFSIKTVQAVKEYLPDCPIEVGDILALKYPAGYFSAYISIGVVEHFEEGPHQALIEARRVLAENGLLFVSVPYFNPLRKLKARLGLIAHEPMADDFYQYAFQRSDFAAILNEMGFEIVAVYPYGQAKGLKDELPLLGALWKRSSKFAIVYERVIGAIPILPAVAGHMILFVARKKSLE